jgi:LPS sulfotransferase NodH
MKENFKASRLRKHLVGYYYNLQNFALDRGFLPGNKNYCKFVIVSRGRTGSTLLRTSLATHHQIKMFGEFFRIPDRIIWHPNFGHETDRAHKLASTDPANFFDNRVFRTYPQNIKAAGFKIFYYHAEEGNFKQVWKYLVEQKDMRIIHNKRRNILKTQLSDKRAWQTGQWAVKNKNIESNQKKFNTPFEIRL